MSSWASPLSFSLPNKQNAHTCTSCSSSKLDTRPAKINRASLIQRNCCSLEVSSSLVVNKNPNSISRRESIAIGVSLGLLAGVSVQTRVAEAAVEGACEGYTESPSGLAYCDQVVGFGPQATQGQLIKAHYVGKLENGKIFDSSYNRGKPLIFRVGVGEVIKGWDQGILGIDGVPPMLTGGKRKLRIPPNLGYGMRGAGCRGGSCIIPPDSVLFFDVEFVGIS